MASVDFPSPVFQPFEIRRFLPAAAFAAGLAIAAAPAGAQTQSECGAVESGTYDPDTGQFTPDSGGNGYRTACSDADGDGRVEGDPGFPGDIGDAYAVVDISGTGARLDIDADDIPVGKFVVRSAGGGSLSASGDGHRALRLRGHSNDESGHLMVETRIDTTATGVGGLGLEVDRRGAGNTATVVNRGAVSTSGAVLTGT